MNKGLYEHIKSDFDFTPSVKQLEAYTQGALKGEELRNMELWISSTEWGNEVGDVLFGDLAAQIDWKNAQGEGVTNYHVLADKVNTVVAVIVSSLLIIGYLTTSAIVDHSSKTITSEKKSPDEIIEAYIEPVVQPQKPVEVQAMRQTINEFKQSTLTLLSTAEEPMMEGLPMVEIQPMKVERIERKIVIKPMMAETEHLFQPNKHQVLYNHDVKYIMQFKCIDYYKEYHRRREVSTGWSSDVEGGEDGIWNRNFKVKTFPVDDILKDAFSSFYKRDYTTTIKTLNQLTAKFPEDLNAKFYQGLCFYQLGGYQKAINLFQEVAEADINIFNEEAEWYLVKSHVQLGEYQTAKNLLELIIATNGFYSDKAKALMQELI